MAGLQVAAHRGSRAGGTGERMLPPGPLLPTRVTGAVPELDANRRRSVCGRLLGPALGRTSRTSDYAPGTRGTHKLGFTDLWRCSGCDRGSGQEGSSGNNGRNWLTAG